MLIGAFVGPAIRAMTPRAAMLGTLAGISVAFISMRPAFQMWEVPWIGLVCFAIVLIAWTANIRLPGGMPGGLVAVIVGSVIGWVVSLLGWCDYMQAAAVSKSLEQFGLRLPIFSADVWQGLAQVAPLLVTAIPLGIYNFTEAMNNVESASAAGDNYNLRKVLLADGVGAHRRLDARQPVPARGVHRPSRAGRPSADASAIRSPPASRSRSSASSD